MIPIAHFVPVQSRPFGQSDVEVTSIECVAFGRTRAEFFELVFLANLYKVDINKTIS